MVFSFVFILFILVIDLGVCMPYKHTQGTSLTGYTIGKMFAVL